MLDSIEEIKEIIKRLEAKKERELAIIPITYNQSGSGTYSNEWLIVNWKANHDMVRLENLIFDLKYNRATIDKKEIAKLEKHLYNIGVLK